jgi:hypothetical protein
VRGSFLCLLHLLEAMDIICPVSPSSNFKVSNGGSDPSHIVSLKRQSLPFLATAKNPSDCIVPTSVFSHPSSHPFCHEMTYLQVVVITMWTQGKISFVSALSFWCPWVLKVVTTLRGIVMQFL